MCVGVALQSQSLLCDTARSYSRSARLLFKKRQGVFSGGPLRSYNCIESQQVISSLM